MSKLGEIGWVAPQISHAVKMLDDVQGTNCAEWRCSCGEEWISSGLHRCPKDPLNADKGIASQEEKAKCDAMRELLAVMHRDGGHYTDEHGVKKSTEVAIAEYYAMREVVEYARKLSKWIEVQRIAWRPTRDDISKEAITIVDGLGESIEKLDVLKGGHWMKRAKYKELTIFEFNKMLDEFLNEPESALCVMYFKLRVRRQHSIGQKESLRIEDRQ